jgi:hypothetical protein
LLLFTPPSKHTHLNATRNQHNTFNTPRPPPTQKQQQQTKVYLKNVLLKFLEAVMAGRASERDALLPAVAALLQATPGEFAAMRRVLANTAPPGAQVLSALGVKW